MRQNNTSKKGDAASFTKLTCRIIELSGRKIKPDSSHKDVFYVYPPGNDTKTQISDYVLVVAGQEGKVGEAIKKAIYLGKKLRKEGLVALYFEGKCEFIKTKSMQFKPVGKV